MFVFLAPYVPHVGGTCNKQHSRSIFLSVLWVVLGAIHPRLFDLLQRWPLRELASALAFTWGLKGRQFVSLTQWVHTDAVLPLPWLMRLRSSWDPLLSDSWELVMCKHSCIHLHTIKAPFLLKDWFIKLFFCCTELFFCLAFTILSQSKERTNHSKHLREGHLQQDDSGAEGLEGEEDCIIFITFSRSRRGELSSGS